MDKYDSGTVELAELGNGVVEMTLRDDKTKNGFSYGVLHGLTRSFRLVSQDDRYKVVILTGHGKYFSSGGTEEELRELHNRERAPRFIFDVIRTIVDCPIPVVAAVQGHAIGGGFVLALYADLIVLARESFYTTNFMKYGFTPAMCSTTILPAKLGPILGQEMLFTGRNYRGAELEKRGIGCTVLPRKEVLAHARQIANNLADTPRTSLVNLKNLCISAWRDAFNSVFEKELASLAATIQDPEVMRRINEKFQK